MAMCVIERKHCDCQPSEGMPCRAAEALRKDGPLMQRGTDADGNPWMGTMRECLEDYKLAAHAEAEGRRYMEREAESLRKDAERYRWLRDVASGGDWEHIGQNTDPTSTDALIDECMEAYRAVGAA